MTSEHSEEVFIKQGVVEGASGEAVRIVWFPNEQDPDTSELGVVRRVPLNVLEAVGLKLQSYSSDSTEAAVVTLCPGSTDIDTAESKGKLGDFNEVYMPWYPVITEDLPMGF